MIFVEKKFKWAKNPFYKRGITLMKKHLHAFVGIFWCGKSPDNVRRPRAVKRLSALLEQFCDNVFVTLKQRLARLSNMNLHEPPSKVQMPYSAIVKFLPENISFVKK